MLDPEAEFPETDPSSAHDSTEFVVRRRPSWLTSTEEDTTGEQFFGIYGPTATANGWSVYPQMRDERRRPCRIDGVTLAWGRYHDNAPTPAEVERWRHQVLGENLALILGRASGNVICVDVDVADEDLAWQIEVIANDELGPSNWRRIGNPPKVAILYRVATAEELPPFGRFTLTEQDGRTPSGHVVEILGQGRSVTAFGRHWKTGLAFEWSTGCSPTNTRPSDVPVVTQAMLDRFVARVEAEVRPFVRPQVSAVEFAAGTESYDGRVYVPAVHMELTKGPDGKIVDGREGYLYRLCSLTCRRNADAVTTPEGLAAVRERIIAAFTETAATTGKWHTLYVQAQVAEKTRRVVADLAAGRLQPLHRAWRPRTEAVAPAAAPAGTFDVASALRWIRPTATASFVSAADGFDATSTAVALTPDAESARVSGDLDAALDRILDDLLDTRESGQDAPAHLLRVPTGGGKTSRLIAKLGDRAVVCRTERDEPLRAVLAVPAHANAEEVLVRAEEAGLVAMVYRGKLRPGMCQRLDVVKPLSEAGIGTSGICSAKVESALEPDGFKVEYCPFFAECPYQAQKSQVADADLIIVPHAYLGLGERLPEVISDVARFVIVDEDMSGVVLHTAQMPIDTIGLVRRPPWLTKKERRAGMVAEDLLTDREDACEIVRPEILAGRDPALALLKTGHGLGLIDSCITVCGRSERIERTLTPSVSMEKVEFYSKMVKASHLRQEWRFWKLLRERLLKLQLDLVAPANGNEARVAKGATDARIRRVRKTVRLSWMSAPALRSLPTVHMDATADEGLVRRIVGRPVEATVIDAALRQVTVLIPDATFSKSSLLLRKGEPAGQTVRKARRMGEIRTAVSSICAHHDGMVLLAAPLAVEAHLKAQGHWPQNLATMHYNATKGLDWAKDAVALITIGEVNARLSDYDDLAAAITWDDDRPETPMVAADGSQPPYETTQEMIPMRDGRAVVLDVNRLDGAAGTFQRIIRDNEIKQAWGRARPVHRSEPVIVYHMGRTVPAGTTVDMVCRLADLTAAMGQVADAVAEGSGMVEAPLVSLSWQSEEARFDRLVAAVEADPALHPGLAVARDADGTAALVSRSATPEVREYLLRSGYDLAAMPARPQTARTDADIEREEADALRRQDAAAMHERLFREMRAWMKCGPDGLWYLPSTVDWGTDRSGKPYQPVGMTARVALQALGERPLPRLVSEDEADAIAA